MSKIKLDSNKYYTEAFVGVQKDLKGVNLFAMPNIESVTINVGCGKYENKQKEAIAKALQKLTHQKPKKIKSRVAISGFKLKKGDIVGIQTTLRGKKMQDFILNLVYLAIPRTRDFHGIKPNAFDKTGRTYSLGIKTASIFPVIGFDSSLDFGMQVNVVFKNSSPDNINLLKKLNFPFAKAQ